MCSFIEKIMQNNFEVPGYLVAGLRLENSATLQGFLEKCSDYIQLATGLPPDSSAADALLTVYPKGKTPADKFVIGFFTESENLIGILDIIRDFPSQSDWWLGLLLLDPAYRRQGLGRKIYCAFEKWVAQSGAQRICLGVIDQNRDAYRFWQTLGFEPLEQPATSQPGSTRHTVITMVHTLTG